MTGRIVVGYTAAKGGKDAVALASRLVREEKMLRELPVPMMVVPRGTTAS